MSVGEGHAESRDCCNSPRTKRAVRKLRRETKKREREVTARKCRVHYKVTLSVTLSVTPMLLCNELHLSYTGVMANWFLLIAFVKMLR